MAGAFDAGVVHAGTGNSRAFVPGEEAQSLLQSLAGWGPVCVIVFSSGSVFEFKGPFPTGSLGQGYYNLQGDTKCQNRFEGHLRLHSIARVALEENLHRGRRSLSLVFESAEGECIFKVFVGRDANGDLIAEQVKAFEQLQHQYS